MSAPEGSAIAALPGQMSKLQVGLDIAAAQLMDLRKAELCVAINEYWALGDFTSKPIEEMRKILQATIEDDENIGLPPVKIIRKARLVVLREVFGR